MCSTSAPGSLLRVINSFHQDVKQPEHKPKSGHTAAGEVGGGCEDTAGSFLHSNWPGRSSEVMRSCSPKEYKEAYPHSLQVLIKNKSKHKSDRKVNYSQALFPKRQMHRGKKMAATSIAKFTCRRKCLIYNSLHSTATEFCKVSRFAHKLVVTMWGTWKNI